MMSIRHSPQQKQENVSRRQFEALLEAYEFVTADISPDLGEDILVRVYDKGVSTGLSFYTQLKSVANINNYLLKSGDISYPFEIKDLEHWGNQAVTVFLVIWDITQNQGWWIWINDAIRYLQEHNPSWRKNETANVHLSSKNRPDESGLSNIRHLLADLYYPVISKDKELTINARFIFPKTPEGKTKFEELKRHFAAGDASELEGKYIELFNFPDWWKRLYGEFETSEMHLTITSNKSRTPRPTKIEFISKTESEAVPYVELWTIKQGDEEVTLSNDQQDIPIKISLILNKVSNENEIKISTNFFMLDGLKAFQALKIQRILSDGGSIKLTLLDSGQELSMTIPPNSFPAPKKSVMDFIQKISTIENATGIKLQFPEDGSFSKEDVLAANELISIIEKGNYQQSGMIFHADLQKAGIAKLLEGLTDGAPIYFQITTEESFVKIFSQKIELGPMMQKIRGYWRMPVEEAKAWFEKATEQESSSRTTRRC
jgi:hypothetical protein